MTDSQLKPQHETKKQNSNEMNQKQKQICSENNGANQQHDWLEVFSAEFLLKESSEVFAASSIFEQFTHVEAPSLHAPLWDVLPMTHNHSRIST